MSHVVGGGSASPSAERPPRYKGGPFLLAFAAAPRQTGTRESWGKGTPWEGLRTSMRRRRPATGPTDLAPIRREGTGLIPYGQRPGRVPEQGVLHDSQTGNGEMMARLVIQRTTQAQTGGKNHAT